MRMLRFVPCLFLLLLAIPAPASASPLPDVLLSTVEGARVELGTTDGETLVGVLRAFDAEVVVLILDDQSVVALERDRVDRVVLADSDTAAPAPSASQTPVVSSEPPPDAAPAPVTRSAPQEEDPLAPPPASEEVLQAQAEARASAQRQNEALLRNLKIQQGFGKLGVGLMWTGIAMTGLGGLLWGVSSNAIDDGDDSLDAQLAFFHGRNLVRVGAPLLITGVTIALVSLAVPTGSFVSQRSVRSSERLARHRRPSDIRLGAAPLPEGGAFHFSMRF